jgi:hypothetical protein
MSYDNGMTRATNNNYYALRWKILKRDNYTCQYCGQHAPNVKLEVDHVIPVIEGGTDDEDNLKTACYACNRGKEGLRIIEKFKNVKTYQPLKLQSPYRPTRYLVLELSKKLVKFKADDIAKELNISIANARMTIHRLIKMNLIEREYRGVYHIK